MENKRVYTSIKKYYNYSERNYNNFAEVRTITRDIFKKCVFVGYCEICENKRVLRDIVLVNDERDKMILSICEICCKKISKSKTI